MSRPERLRLRGSEGLAILWEESLGNPFNAAPYHLEWDLVHDMNTEDGMVGHYEHALPTQTRSDIEDICNELLAGRED